VSQVGPRRPIPPRQGDKFWKGRDDEMGGNERELEGREAPRNDYYQVDGFATRRDSAESYYGGGVR